MRNTSVRTAIFLAFCLCLLFAQNTGASMQQPKSYAPAKAISALQIPFVENKGQTYGDIQYYASSFWATTAITASGDIMYGVPVEKKVNSGASSNSLYKHHHSRQMFFLERLVNTARLDIHPVAETDTSVSVFRGADPMRWQPHLESYGEISLGKVYEGVEARLQVHGNRVEKVFYLAPHADSRLIQLQIPMADRLEVLASGELNVGMGQDAVQFSKPLAWQEVDGAKVDVAVSYRVMKKDTYGFDVADYDRNHPLVIDPLLQSTYIGDLGYDYVNAITVGGDGSVYVAGTTTSSNFPKCSGSICLNGADPDFGEWREGFIAKLTPDLSRLVQATYLGGNPAGPPPDEVETITAITLDANGDVYVAGHTTSADFPGRTGGADTDINGQDGFVAKLSGNLQTLYRSSFIGGTDTEEIHDIAMKNDGEVVVVGTTTSSDLPPCMPAVPGCGLYARPDSSFAGASEAFVARFTANLDGFYSTFVGGDNDDAGTGIMVAQYGDKAGDVYITGTITNNAPQSSVFPGIDGGAGEDGFDITAEKNEAFVSWLSPDLMTIQRSSFLGGSEDESSNDIAGGVDGSVYIVGQTDSLDFPPCGINVYNCPGMADGQLIGWEGFVARFNPTLTDLYGSTYLGGNGQTDNAYSIATIVNPENIYGTLVLVGGETNAADFPGIQGGDDSSLSGTSDAFLVLFETTLDEIRQATLYGGGQGETLTGVAFGPNADIYIAGYTLSSDLHKTGSGFISTPSSSITEGFAAHFSNLKKGGAFYLLPQKNGKCPVLYLGE